MLPTDHPLAPVPSWRNPEAAMALLLLTQTNADGETEGKHGFQSLPIKEPGILPIVSGAVCSLKQLSQEVSSEDGKSLPESPRPVTNTAQWGQPAFWRKQAKLFILRGHFSAQFTRADFQMIYCRFTNNGGGWSVVSFLQIEEMEKGEGTMR